MTDLNDFFYTDGVDDVLATYVNRLVAGNLRGELTNVETLSANKTLNDASFPIQSLTATGADRTVFMPPAASTNHQIVFRNSGGAFSIIIKNDAGTFTYATLFPGDTVTLVPVAGTTWCAVGGVSGLGYGMNFPIGMLRNGRIVPSVSSNNLTVAIKTSAGNDPSLGEPVWVKIGNTERKIVAALSVTINAGTNTFNAGSAELGTKEIDYFVYLSFKTSASSVVLLVSRIPYGTLYSDFSSTATNETYAAASSAPASTDECVVIGRFAATLSLGAGYTWSVPTFTASNLINRPIYETRRLAWTPTFTNLTTTSGTLVASYQLGMGWLDYTVSFTFGASSTIGGDVTHTLPFSAVSSASVSVVAGTLRLNDASVGGVIGFPQLGSTTSVSYRTMNAAGTYATAAVLSSTVPFTWTTSDAIIEWLRYFIF